MAAEPVLQSSRPAASATGWAYTLEGYGYLPWLHSSTTVKGFTANTTLAPGQILNLLQSVGTIRGSVEHDRLGLITDLAYTQLGAARSTTGRRGLLTGRASVTAINGFYDFVT